MIFNTSGVEITIFTQTTDVTMDIGFGYLRYLLFHKFVTFISFRIFSQKRKLESQSQH